VADLLRLADFEINQASMCPTALGVLTGRTGYLIPQDLKDFDEVVDKMVNGKFYECQYEAEEVVGNLKVRNEPC
jgi:NAD kinase